MRRNGTIDPKKFQTLLRAAQFDLPSTRIPSRPGTGPKFASRDEARKEIIKAGLAVVARGLRPTQERVAAEMRYAGREGLAYHLDIHDLDWKGDILPAIKSLVV